MLCHKHFSGMDKVAEAVAIDGFGELAEVLSEARRGRRTAKATLKRVAQAYLDFAANNPALYDAMFTRATTLRFADADTPPNCPRASLSCVGQSHKLLVGTTPTPLPRCYGRRCTGW